MMESILSYECPPQACPVAVHRQGDVTQIVVAMYGLYAPVPRWTCHLDAATLVVAPLCCLISATVRSTLRIPAPPRLVIEISRERFRFELRNRSFGDLFLIDVPRSDVVVVRANRFEPGLWLDVRGRVKETFLEELPRGTINAIDAAVRDAFGDEAPPV